MQAFCLFMAAALEYFFDLYLDTDLLKALLQFPVFILTDALRYVYRVLGLIFHQYLFLTLHRLLGRSRRRSEPDERTTSEPQPLRPSRP